MTTATRVRVIVDRDMQKIVTDVLRHELPLLEAVHGQGAVQIVKELGEVEIDAVEAEFARLDRTYRSLNVNPLPLVFPAGPADLARVLGVRYERRIGEVATEEPQALVIDHAEAKPARRRKAAEADAEVQQ